MLGAESSIILQIYLKHFRKWYQSYKKGQIIPCMQGSYLGGARDCFVLNYSAS